MGSRFRIRAAIALGVSASAVLAAACASEGRFLPSRSASIYWEGDRLGDFAAARYAAQIGDRAAAADYYASAYRKSTTDPEALDMAAASALLATRPKDAARVAAMAPPDVLAEAPFASLALIADDIANDRLSRARRLLARAQFDDGNATIVRALTAAVASDRLIEETTASLDMRAPTKACILQLSLSSRGKGAPALRAGVGIDASRAIYPACVAERARLLAEAGEWAASTEVLKDFQSALPGQPADPALGRLAATLSGPEEPDAVGEPPTVQEAAAAALFLAAQDVGGEASDQTATAYLVLALHIDPEADFLRLRLAEALRRQDQNEFALAVLQKVKPDSAYAPFARIREARLETRLGRVDQAIASLEAAVGELDEAGTTVSGAQAREIRLQAADAYRVAGDNARAEALLSTVIALNTNLGVNDWRPLFARAQALDALGRWPEAEQDLRRALDLAPREAEVLNYLGYNWVDRGTGVEAGLEMIRKALRINPRAPHIIDSLGWAMFRLGRYDEAVEQLLLAAELSPISPGITSHLGDALWRAGRHDEARYEWARALRLQPIGATEQALERKLRDGLPEETAALEPNPRQLLDQPRVSTP